MNLLFKLLLAISLALEVFGANVRFSRNFKEFQCPPEDGFYPADDQCTGSHYYCASGVPFPQECPCSAPPDQCTVFDPAVSACVDPGMASCSPGGGSNSTTLPPTGTDATGLTDSTGSAPPADGSTTPGSGSGTTISVATSSSSLPSYTCPGDGFYPVPGTCSPDYYICAGDIVGNGVCPEGTLFDPVTYKCTPAEETTCNMPFTCPAEEGFFPYPGGCSAVYYICIDGVGYIQYCPENTIFDPVLLACVREPSCTPGQLSTTESTAGPTGVSTDAVTSETTYVTEAPAASTTPFFCVSDGDFPIPGECKDYYICIGGVAFVGTCPGELVFNSATSKCDYPDQVPECANVTALVYGF